MCLLVVGLVTVVFRPSFVFHWTMFSWMICARGRHEFPNDSVASIGSRFPRDRLDHFVGPRRNLLHSTVDACTDQCVGQLFRVDV